jgi:hypothetical protein
VHNQFFSDQARDHFGDHVIAFASAVHSVTGGNGRVLFLDGEQTPLETLLGNVQADPASPAERAGAQWVVRHVKNAAEMGREGAVAVSGPIDQVAGEGPGVLGLFRAEPGEAARLYEEAEAAVVQFSDDTHTIGTVAEARRRWLQFWRLHGNVPEGKDPVSPPAPTPDLHKNPDTP